VAGLFFWRKNKMEDIQEQRLWLRINDILNMTGFSRSTLDRIRKSDPDFPKPCVIGSIQVWDALEFESWVRSKRDTE
jgi:predicted DNA-binding transcriptional regulator AlpA